MTRTLDLHWVREQPPGKPVVFLAFKTAEFRDEYVATCPRENVALDGSEPDLAIAIAQGNTTLCIPGPHEDKIRVYLRLSPATAAAEDRIREHTARVLADLIHQAAMATPPTEDDRRRGLARSFEKLLTKALFTRPDEFERQAEQEVRRFAKRRIAELLRTEGTPSTPRPRRRKGRTITDET